MIIRPPRKIVIPFILALVLIAGLGAISIWSMIRLVDSARLVAHTFEVLGRLENTISDLKDMETSIRGYIIADDSTLLQPYWKGSEELDSDLSELRALTADNPTQQRNLDRLALALTERTSQLQHLLDTHRLKGFEESQNLVRTNQGLTTMDTIRGYIDAMKAHERILLDTRRSREDETVTHTKVVLLVGATTALALLFGAFRLLQRETAQRLLAQQASQAYLERIRDLYDGASCGYHSVDKNGIYQEINQTELSWLGYRREEVIGKIAVRDVMTEAGKKAFQENFPRLVKEGTIREVETEIQHRDGTIRTVLVSATAIRNAEGNFLSSRTTTFDITDRKAADRRIADLNAATERNAFQLQAANDELEAFSYTVSHDLRSPLRHLDGFVQLLRKRYSDNLDERGKRYLSVISDAARQMGQLIDDLLDFAKMGRSDMNFIEVDSAALVQEVVESFAGECALRQIEWKIAPLPKISGDRAMLRVVWTNLVANAIKYTRPRVVAQIEIYSELRETGMWFFIRDNGVGFAMEHASKLFGVFQRLHSSEDFEGTGIGLASVRRIILRHGGRVMAEGNAGHGAMVYFMLPIQKSYD